MEDLSALTVLILGPWADGGLKIAVNIILSRYPVNISKETPSEFSNLVGQMSPSPT